MKAVVLDLETKKTFDEVGGREHMDKLGVTVVGVYDYPTDSYKAYREEELGALQNHLISSDLIIGFNHIGFDLPVLKPYFSIDVEALPNFDIMVECQKILGHRIGLDSLAKATLDIGKTGSGLDAIRYYREGKWDLLEKYCLNDVKVTKDIFEYGLKHKKIHYFSRFGQQKKTIKVNWQKYKNPEKLNQDLAPAQYKLF